MNTYKILNIGSVLLALGFVVLVGTAHASTSPSNDTQENAFIQSQQNKEDVEADILSKRLDKIVNENTPVAHTAIQNSDGSIDLK